MVCFEAHVLKGNKAFIYNLLSFLKSNSVRQTIISITFDVKRIPYMTKMMLDLIMVKSLEAIQNSSCKCTIYR